jgi:NAD(P)-dependent dehydrogenase (short-subunit alcohol dehydrogenase family)
MEVKGKVIIITGAGAGIGAATALLFARKGAKVCCNDITDSADIISKKIKDEGGDGFFCQGDVTKIEDSKKIINKTIEKYGKIDILFNNAGIVFPGRADNTTIEDWEGTMAVNVRGVFLMSKFAMSYLRKTKGCIINASSSVAIKGVKDRFAYTASKGAILSMTRAMAMDYMDEGIRVNSICPGTTDTPSLRKRLSKFDDPEAARKIFISRQPLGRFGKPDEIARGVLYLVNAEFCTGINLSVDGGMTI